MAITSRDDNGRRGRQTTRKVEGKPIPKGPGVVKIPKRDGVGCRFGKASAGDGVLIGDVWLVFHGWDRDRVSYSILAPHDIQVNTPVPVVLDS